MGEVKRYSYENLRFEESEGEFSLRLVGGYTEDPTGKAVLYSDHLREATRLHRASLKLFVRCLELMAQVRVHVLEYGGPSELQRKDEWWSQCMKRLEREAPRLQRLANYIEAKYLRVANHD